MRQVLAGVIWLATALTASPVFAASGDLDPTFGSDGLVTTDFGLSIDFGYDVALQTDGKLVVAGTMENGSGIFFALARYNPDGSLDSNFDSWGPGLAITDVGTGDDEARSIAVQSDGKIIVAGSNYDFIDNDFALARYNTDGSLDATFGSGGTLTTAIGSGNDLGWSVAVQSDGKIVVAGESFNGSDYDFALARYNTDGTLDATFGSGGLVSTDIGSGDDGCRSIALQSDGKIVVAGNSFNGGDDDFALARYNTDGTLDTTFGSGGMVTTNIGSGDDIGKRVVVQSDGKVVMAGESFNGSDYDWALARYNTDGTLDAAFGTGGLVTTASTDACNGLVLQPDEKIVVAGSGNLEFLLARYDVDGNLDSTFGNSGLASAGLSSSYAAGVAVQSDDKIVAAGAAFNSNWDFALVRYEGGTADIVAPVTTADPVGGTYNSAQLVSLTCDDGAGSGCESIYYTTDGTTPTTGSTLYTSAIDISADTELKFFATDVAGNQETVQTESYRIDPDAPSTTASPVGGTYSSSQSVSLTCDDGTGSGCDAIYYTIDGTTPTTGSTLYSSAIDIAADTDLKFFATDLAGNQEAVQTETYTFTADSVAPVTTASPVGGTYSNSQSVSLTCDDGTGRGCDAIYYTTDGSTPTTSSAVYSSAIGVTVDTTLKFFATDLAGNQETVQTEFYIIDPTDPVTTASPVGGIYNSVQSVNLSCDDGTGSGCGAIYYTTDGSSPTTASSVFSSDISIAENTTVTMKYFATDLAGNAEEVNTDIYTVDTIPPTVSVDTPASLINDHNPLFSISLSETATVETYLNGTLVSKLSSGKLNPDGDADLKLLEGPNTIRVEATDLAGNFGSTEMQVTVDSLIDAPFIDDPPALWTETSYTLTGRAEQDSTVTVSAPAGVSVGSVTRDSSDATIWTCPLSNLTTGVQSISASAEDLAGNVSEATTATLNVDVDILSPVTVTAIDTFLGGTVDLDWSAYAETASRFDLYLAKKPFADVTGMTPFRRYDGATTQGRIDGLTNGSSWHFAVVAVNAAGTFESQVSTVSVTPVRQGVFGQVSSTDNGGTLRNIEVTGTSLPLVTTDSEGRFSIAGLPTGSYTLQVGESGGDDRFVGTSVGIEVLAGVMTEQNVALATNIAQGPSTPLNPAAVARDGEVELTWDPVADADLTGFRVYRDGSATPLTSYLIAGTSFSDGTVVNGTSYSYTMRAVNAAGVESADSATASATPVAAVPRAPSNLKATLNLNCDGSGEPTVTLTWDKSPTATSYNVYWNSGDALDYSTFETVSGVDTVIWTSAILTPDQGYAFGVRAVNGSGEELNTSVALTVNVDTGVRARITEPVIGLRVSGDALALMAEPSKCGEVSEIDFQYRKSGDIQWLDITPAKASTPNPATTAPYLVHWDVTGTEFDVAANYEMRAVAHDLAGNADPTPPLTTVTIDNNTPGFLASDSTWSRLSVKKALVSGRDNAVVLVGNGVLDTVGIFLPTGSLESDTTMIAAIPPKEEMAGLANESSLGNFLRFKLLSGQTDFGTQLVDISMSYPDTDGDGIVDTLGVDAGDLTLCYYNEVLGAWEVLQQISVDQVGKTVSGTTDKPGLFGLFGKSGLASLSAPGKVFMSTSTYSGDYQVSWFPVLDAEIYELQEATDSVFTQNVKTVYSGSTANHDIFDQNKGEYYYRVRSVRGGAQPSAWRVGQHAVTVERRHPCEAPRKLYVPASTETGTFRVSWIPSPTEGASYELEMDDGSGYEPIYKGVDSYYDASGYPGGTYSFRVRAHKQGVPSSAYVGGSVNVEVKCGTPRKIYLPASNPSGSFQISWASVPTPGVSYVLEESVNGGAFSEVYRGTNSNHNLSGLQNGTHVYRVKAVAPGYQDSTYRSSAPCVVSLECDAPRKVFLPTDTSSGSFQISWFRSRIAGVTYVLEVSLNGGTTFEPTPVYTGTDANANISGLSAGEYTYRVKAQKAGYADSSWRWTRTVTVN